jgi:hypothetical protein
MSVLNCRIGLWLIGDYPGRMVLVPWVPVACRLSVLAVAGRICHTFFWGAKEEGGGYYFPAPWVGGARGQCGSGASTECLTGGRSGCP